MTQFNNLQMKEKFNCIVKFKKTHNNKIIILPTKKKSQTNIALNEA